MFDCASCGQKFNEPYHIIIQPKVNEKDNFIVLQVSYDGCPYCYSDNIACSLDDIEKPNYFSGIEDKIIKLQKCDENTANNLLDKGWKVYKIFHTHILMMKLRQ